MELAQNKYSLSLSLRCLSILLIISQNYQMTNRTSQCQYTVRTTFFLFEKFNLTYGLHFDSRFY